MRELGFELDNFDKLKNFHPETSKMSFSHSLHGCIISSERGLNYSLVLTESTLTISLLVGIVTLGVISEIAFHKIKIPEPIVLLSIGLLIQYSNLLPNEVSTLNYLRAIAPTLGTIVLGLVLLDAGLSMRAYDMLYAVPKCLHYRCLNQSLLRLVFRH